MRDSSVPRPLAAALALATDRLVPEPPSAFHPVALFGRSMARLEATLYADRRANGVAHAAIGIALGSLAGSALGSTAAATHLAVAGRSLASEARRIARTLDDDDLESARDLLPALVGRDPSDLDEKEIVRGVVESVAENTVDAVVAPALWGALAGAPGALGYRAVNTLDAMVGHRSSRYASYGWASARFDDAAAWVPARITAGLVAAVRPSRAPDVWRAVQTQAPDHPSPNAGVAEAAFAAALNLRLGGQNRYGEQVEVRPTLGFGAEPARGDINRAVALSLDVGTALGVGLAVIGAAQWWRAR